MLDQPWAFRPALYALLSATIAILYALYILMYPPRHRKASVLLLTLPVAYAAGHMMELTPDITANDTFGRFLLIWLAHMSYEVAILEYTPAVTIGEDDWRARLKAAYSVLFDRNHHAQQLEDEKNGMTSAARVKHSYSKLKFIMYHITKAVALSFVSYIWYTEIDTPTAYTQYDYAPEKASFFRRLPASLGTRELHNRLVFTLDWCIISMFLYETIHSVFAVLFVGLLRLDHASEWSLALFGSLSEASSVRRYWGKHWHNYIYYSFSAHVKIVTRDWLGLVRGRTHTRLLENTLVFVASGLMHAIVRRVQNGGDGDSWCIAIWYSAQMIPIVVEGIVQHLWAGSKARFGLSADSEVVLERFVGYVWVACWFLWSVPKYIFVRYAWEQAIFKAKYTEALV